MSGYRVYILDSSGRVEQRIDLECEDDENAKVQAEQLVDGHDVELWQLARRIAKFDRKT